MAKNIKVSTTEKFISSFSGSVSVGTVVETLGYTTEGDGGGASWKKTATTGTASQSPLQLNNDTLNDASGYQWALVDKAMIDPRTVGATGLQASNDAPYLSLAFKIFRDRIVSLQNQLGSVTLNGGNVVYGADDSVNATNLSGWNYKIQNLSVYGRCTGKAILDFVGSRGGSMENVSTYGDQSSMPSEGIQFARSSAAGFGFCDNWVLKNVSTVGFYSTAGAHFRAQETTHYDHCRFWNQNPDARAAIHTGTNNFAMTSFVPILEASASYINNKYTNIDYRYLPTGNISAITGITNANPAVVTMTNTSFLTNGDLVTIVFVSGMSEINDVVYTIANVTATTIELAGINSSAFGAYTSGGSVIKSQSVPTIYLARCEQHTFDTCYAVAYGQPQIEFGFPDPSPPDQVKLDFLFEGAGMQSHVHFTGNTTERSIYGFELETYNTHTKQGILSSDSSNIVNLKGGKIVVNSYSKTNPALFDLPSKYKLNDIAVTLPNAALTSFKSIPQFYGSVYDKALETKTLFNNLIRGVDDGLYTPTITAETGTLTTVTVSLAEYRTLGDTVYIKLVLVITDAGTALNSLIVTLPTTSGNGQMLNGREGTNGAQLQGQISGAGTVTIRKYDNTSAIATGAQIIVSGMYKIN